MAFIHRDLKTMKVSTKRLIKMGLAFPDGTPINSFMVNQGKVYHLEMSADRARELRAENKRRFEATLKVK